MKPYLKIYQAYSLGSNSRNYLGSNPGNYDINAWDDTKYDKAGARNFWESTADITNCIEAEIWQRNKHE